MARRLNRPTNRRSVRLPGYDYRQRGAYFITVCAHTRSGIDPFSRIIGGVPELTAMGRVAEECWIEIPEHFPFVALDAFVIMPDHIHGIVVITDAAVNPATRPTHASPVPWPPSTSHPRGPAPGSLAAIVGSFKAAASRRINHRRGTPGAPVWQRNYYERIIRDDRALREIRRYIIRNPATWDARVGTTRG